MSAAEANSLYAIEALDIHKSFAGVAALRGCNLRVRRGEIHALLGQNGAGKSTLVKILNGVHPRASFEGQIRVEGRAVAFHSSAHARRHRVGYVPQEIEVIENLSVAENIFAGQMSLGRALFVPWRQLRQRATALLEDIGLSFDLSGPVASLSAAQRHLVMIVRALAADPAVLILDEPTASVSSSEIERLFAVLRRLRARGTTMIYITHRLPELFALCDRASVLRDGLIAEEYPREAFGIDTLVTAMSGRRANFQLPRRLRSNHAPLLLSATNLRVSVNGSERVRDVSFDLRQGEILGIAGLLGAGKTELLNALYGCLPHQGGIALSGQPVSIKSPRDARDAGIALLTEDRRRSGLLFNLPVRGNITLGNLRLFSKAGWIAPGRELQSVLSQIAQLSIKAPSPEAAVAHLSGGNQQKLLFARLLLRQPKVLLLDDPSKGVDIATRHDIYRLIAALAESGMGIIVVSSDLEEVIALADRVLVMAEGRFIDAFARGAGGEERVLSSIARHHEQALTH